MAEKQPTAYVVCRYTVTLVPLSYGDNMPVKVFDTRREARLYRDRMNARSRRYSYAIYAVKQG